MFEVRNSLADVGHVESHVVAGEVGVLRPRLVLVRGRVLEELDARAGAASELGDLIDHRPRMHTYEARHQASVRIEERAELERRYATENIDEPVARLSDIGHSDAKVVDPEHTWDR